MKYHPDSGPLQYDTAEKLDAALGDHMRAVYPGLKYHTLHTVLRMRRKAVLVSRGVLRQWCDVYASVSSSVQAAASSAQAVTKRVLKRPAAQVAGGVLKRPAAAGSARVAKRPAAVDWEEPVSKQQATAASSSTDVVCIKLLTGDAVEAACGKRYREQVSDLGLGLNYPNMQVRLKAWGYEAGPYALREWLGKYRLGDGAKHGNCAVYALSRRDLQYWYHVEGLRGRALVDKYRAETGVFAHWEGLERWLKAPSQQLAILENAEEIHSHVCGEYVLEQLQKGVSAEEVKKQLLAQYLVDCRTTQRLVAYRRYREQRGEYWTSEHLEQQEWEFLYSFVSVDSKLGHNWEVASRSLRSRAKSGLEAVRVSLCQRLGVAEELVPLHNLSVFFGAHERHAKLALEYPGAFVYKDVLPGPVVEAYEKTFQGQVLPRTAHACISDKEQGWYARACSVATADRCIVFPKMAADACLIAAYAMLKCQEVFQRQSWSMSLLTRIQATYKKQYNLTDFAFWVCYGSWSACEACGSFFFNDEYFSNRVYQDRSTSEQPDMLAAYRRQVPQDPVVHACGQVGISSRWWYKPGMYTPVVARCPCCSGKETPLEKFNRRMQNHGQALKVTKTSELYRIPLATKSGYEAKECITWPRYSFGQFSLDHSTGPCMHEMTVDECRALSIVVLRTSVQQERYGAAHQFNWKKVGLSRAYFKKDLVCEASMPTDRCKAAFHFLREHSKYYRSFLTHQRIRRGAAVAPNPPPPKKKNTNKITIKKKQQQKQQQQHNQQLLLF